MSSSPTALVPHTLLNANPTYINTTITPSNYTVSLPVGAHAANTELKKIDFYIYVHNGVGTYVLSAKISIEEQCNCYYDQFHIDVLKQNFISGETSSYTDDFSVRFTHDCPDSLCPITKYELEMVEDNDETILWSQSEIDLHYELTETLGLFQINVFDQPYNYNKIYVKVFNSEIWSNVTLTGPVAEIHFQESNIDFTAMFQRMFQNNNLSSY